MQPRQILALTVTLALLPLASCSWSGSRRVNVSDFSINQSIKSASMDYAVTLADTIIYMRKSTSVQWPLKLGVNSIQALQDTLLAHLYDAPAGQSINRAISNYVTDTRDFDYFDTAQVTTIDSIPSGPDALACHYISSSAKMISLSERLVSYQVMHTWFLGGAHPGMAIHPFSYDLERAVVLTEHNMFVPGSRESLLRDIRISLARDLNCTVDDLQEEGIFVDELNNLGSPYIMGNIVAFHYDPYEIAPYAMGQIVVNVPASAIEGCLTPELKELLGMQ